MEVTCTGGITADGRWVRLFPVPFRLLDQDKRYKKYQWISLKIKKASDARPESFNVNPDSIKLLSPEPIDTKNKWEERKKIVFPLLASSYCFLKAQRDNDGHPTLGVFRPRKINRLTIEDAGENWTEQELAKLQQADLFNVGPIKELEKIPHKFSYEFLCAEEECSGHKFMCTDWEMAQAYRAWKRQYGKEWEKPFRQRFEDEMISKKDTHFYVGTVHQHPANWIIVGLFYPPL